MRWSDRDRAHMRHAIACASKGIGRTHPNPSVGCVIVSGDGEVIATGYHTKAGEAHAEVAALSVLDVHRDLSDATLYVTLEPCCIHGRTPPCTDSILAAGIGRVVVGSVDPDPRVDGRGVEALRAHGVEVVVGVERDASDALIASFAKRVLHGLPWVSAKWAMSLDGKIATHTSHASWITGEAARQRGHELRNTHDAIMVGTRTLIEDDPLLTCRIEGGRDPWRILVDTSLRAPESLSALDASTSSAPTLVLVGERAPTARRVALEKRGVEVVEIPQGEDGYLDPLEMLRALADRGLTSVLVEGGGALIGSFFDACLVDTAYAFIAPKLIGGAEAITPVAGQGHDRVTHAASLAVAHTEHLGDDLLIWGDLHGSHRAFVPTWNAAHPS